MLTNRPPCWPPDTPAPNPCAYRYAEFVVYGKIDLEGAWRGWRVRGEYLVAPGGGRLPVRLLRSLATTARERQQEKVSRLGLTARTRQSSAR